jgi:tetratricopeptide (TPR) repeat protein
MIFTFYSYKGGVGRSMAMANVGEWLCQQGLRVVMVDWDLEAPGLESFFFPGGTGTDDVRSEVGLIDVLGSYQRAFPQVKEAFRVAARDRAAGGDDLPLDVKVDILDDVLPPLRAALYPLRAPNPGGSNGSGALWLLPAGLREGDRMAAYARAVQTFDWDELYGQLEGHAYFEWMRRQLSSPELSDVVLIDSRTGVTEMGGVCTRQMADTVVIFCAPNEQNLEGMVSMAGSFNREDLAEVRGRSVQVVLVPARVDSFNDTRLNEFRREFDARTDAFTPPMFRHLKRTFWGLRIPYTPAYAYYERLAIGDTNGVEELEEAFKRLTAHLAMLAAPHSAMRRRLAPEIERVFGRLLPRVAIAYALRDRVAAHSVRRRLEEANIAVWPEPDSAGTDTETRTTIDPGVLEQTHFLVLVLTAASVDSSSVRNVWRHARQLGACIVPVTIEGAAVSSPPPWLGAPTIWQLPRDWDAIVAILARPWTPQRVPFMAPELTPNYVARPRLLAQLKEMVLGRGARRVALHGLSGSGKSTMAAAFCRDAAVEGFFADGILWASAAREADPRQEMSKLYEALSGEQPAFLDAGQAASALASRLAGKRCLLVIDRAVSADALKSFPIEIPECRYLITTEDRGVGLVADAEPLAVGEMTTAEANALLKHHLGSQAPPESVLEPLAAELGRLPLALRVAAHVLRSAEENDRVGESWPPPSSTAVYAPRQFVERLVNRLRSSPGNDLTAGVQAALSALGPVDQERLAQLVFMPGAEAVAVSQLAQRWQTDESDVLRTLSRLSDLGLVEFDSYVTVHPLVRAAVIAVRPDLDVDRTHDAAFVALSPENQSIARQVLSRLVRLSDDTNAVAPQCVSISQLTTEQNAFLDRLAQLKLVAYEPGGDGTFALANPAAADGWQRLRQWVDEDREFLKWRQRLDAYCSDWQRTKDPGALLAGTLLEEARGWLKKRPEDFGPLERRYVEHSLDRSLTASRGRKLGLAAAVAVALGLVLAGGAFYLTGRPGGATPPSPGAESRPDPSALVSRGDDLAQHGDLAGARAAYTAALEQITTDPSLFLKRGNARLQDADAAGALADFDEAIKLDPTNPRAYHSRAAARAASGQTQAAVADYGDAIRLDPSFGDAYLNRASLFETGGDRDKAVRDLQRAVKVSKDPLLRTAATARLQRLGASPGAVTAAPRAVPTRETVYLHLTDGGDKRTAEDVADALRRRKYAVAGIQVVEKARTAGDVRYTGDDEQAARDIATIVEDALAGKGYAVRMRLIAMDRAQLPGAQRGRIEVWIPPLMRPRSAS